MQYQIDAPFQDKEFQLVHIRHPKKDIYQNISLVVYKLPLMSRYNYHQTDNIKNFMWSPNSQEILYGCYSPKKERDDRI